MWINYFNNINKINAILILKNYIKKQINANLSIKNAKKPFNF